MSSIKQLFLGGSSAAAYQIERSLRFDSVYLDRTPASTGNRRTWTWSGWIKLGTNFGTRRMLFGGGAAFVAQTHPNTYIEITDDNVLGIDQVTATTGTLTIRVRTSAVLRDPSAWYHVIIAVDTTQGTDTNRVKMYINGVQQTSFSSTTYPTSNLDTGVNTTTNHKLGSYIELSAATLYFDGYMTEVNFIDGQQLAASDFGLTDSATGVWVPKKYTGTYGTNGFYLKFADNSSNTATTLGKDSSGNGNNWTPNGFSVNAGAGNDSLVDTPTPYGTDTGAGGEVRGNYCTLNPLKQTGASLTNGNLQFTKSGAASTLYTIHPTFFVSSGKWYFETTPTAINAAGSLVGIVGADVALTTYASLSSMTGNIWAWRQDSYKVNNGSSSLYGNTWTANDVIGIAIDMDNGKIWWSKNGTWQASGDPAAGTNAAFTNVSGSVGPLLIDQGITATFEGSINAGQRPFAYTAPSGFKALCTQNLPTPTIGATATTRADDYFNTIIWSGTGSGTTRAFTGVGFQPDFVWTKPRNSPTSHSLYDAVRGAGNNKELTSNANAAEGAGNQEQYGYLSSFDSDGFTSTAGTLGAADNVYFNYNTYTYVAWNWKANGAGSSNTAGTITSTVSVNTTAGFSVVTYTGTGVNATVGHGLNVAPQMVIVKRRSAADAWYVFHTSLPSGYAIQLNNSTPDSSLPTIFNSTAPTSTVFSIGTDSAVNANTATYVAYCFSPVAGYSAFGRYTGNGSTDGPFIYTGFRPAWVLVKTNSTNGDWLLYDNKRNAYNVVNNILYPNSGIAEATSGGGATLDFVSNGFKLRGAGAGFNDSGATFIYAAFAEVPTKFSLAR